MEDRVTDPTEPKTYGSKREIYKDYRIAIKFIPDFPVRHKSNYAKLLSKIEQELGGEMKKIAEGLRNYDDYPLQSHAFFLQVPSLDDAGNEIGPKYVLLTHETGLEVFLIPAAIFVGVEFAKWAAKKAFDGSFSKLVE